METDPNSDALLTCRTALAGAGTALVERAQRAGVVRRRHDVHGRCADGGRDRDGADRRSRAEGTTARARPRRASLPTARLLSLLAGSYTPSPARYERMIYNRVGRSGLKLPAVSLGLWQNFGDDRPLDTSRAIAAPRLRPRHHALRPGQQLRAALRLGRGELRPDLARRLRAASATSSSSRRRRATTCGRARTASGARASTCWRASTRALRRMGLDYVDIFYSHRFDPDTPLEETMGALDTAVRQGKALYVGISSYSAEKTRRGSGDPARAGHAAADPPAVLLDAQPLDRARAARHARGGRRRLHRLLAARAGDAHRQVPRRHPGGLASEPARPPCRRTCSPTRRSRGSAR